jgi:hypothetical protein
MVRGDDHFSASVPGFQITEGFSHVAEWIPSIDDRHNVSGFEEIFHDHQIWTTSGGPYVARTAAFIGAPLGYRS